MERYDNIIIGAGLYGLYAALFLCERGRHVMVLECDASAFGRATYINQARVHQGYHYPRSISTAMKSAGYFERFQKDYAFCLNKEFEQIYAISSCYSWSDAKQFKEFCRNANIECEELCPDNYFKKGMCDGVFRTREFTYDAMMLRQYFLEKLSMYAKRNQIKYNIRITNIEKMQDSYMIYTDDGQTYESGFVLNATYAGTNQILDMLGFDKFSIKYELCEIILCNTNEKLQRIGFTVMDGPFFSIMPFGKTKYHSLTSVTFTPHITSFEPLPVFACQEKSKGYCSAKHLGNCNDCVQKPDSAYPYMANLAKKYMLDEYQFEYYGSLFSMKPILTSSEIDDSRPTVIKTYSRNPTFIGALSGKINTVYDLEEVLSDGM